MLFDFARPNAQRATDAFLGCLFEADPGIERRFGSDLRRMRPVVEQAWAKMLRFSQDRALLRRVLRRMVEAFGALGANPAQVAVYSSAILKQLRRFSARQCEREWMDLCCEALRDLPGRDLPGREDLGQTLRRPFPCVTS